VVKSGYDGHIPLIYLVVLTLKRTHAELLEARTSVYHGAHRCALGAHGSEGARTPAPPWGGATTHAPREGMGAHVCALGMGAHVCALGAGTPAPLHAVLNNACEMITSHYQIV
jgi:transcription elongation factor